MPELLFREASMEAFWKTWCCNSLLAFSLRTTSMECFRFLPRCVFPNSMTQSFFAKLHFCSDSFRRWMRAWSLARMWVSPIGGSCPMKPGRRKGKPGSASLDLPIGSLTHNEKMQVTGTKDLWSSRYSWTSRNGKNIPTYTTSQNCVLSDPSCASSFPSFDSRP